MIIKLNLRMVNTSVIPIGELCNFKLFFCAHLGRRGDGRNRRGRARRVNIGEGLEWERKERRGHGGRREEGVLNAVEDPYYPLIM